MFQNIQNIFVSICFQGYVVFKDIRNTLCLLSRTPLLKADIEGYRSVSRLVKSTLNDIYSGRETMFIEYLFYTCPQEKDDTISKVL